MELGTDWRAGWPITIIVWAWKSRFPDLNNTILWFTLDCRVERIIICVLKYWTHVSERDWSYECSLLVYYTAWWHQVTDFIALTLKIIVQVLKPYTIFTNSRLGLQKVLTGYRKSHKLHLFGVQISPLSMRTHSPELPTSGSRY